MSTLFYRIILGNKDGIYHRFNNRAVFSLCPNIFLFFVICYKILHLTAILYFFPFFFQEINYDSPRGGVSVITEKGEITTSYLLIQRAKIGDSGKYTCSPSHANPQTVNVHVLNGKFMKIQIYLFLLMGIYIPITLSVGYCCRITIKYS